METNGRVDCTLREASIVEGGREATFKRDVRL